MPTNRVTYTTCTSPASIAPRDTNARAQYEYEEGNCTPRPAELHHPSAPARPVSGSSSARPTGTPPRV